MELIRKTKEFLRLNKTYDDMQSVLLLIKQAKLDQDSHVGRLKLAALPEKLQELIKNAGNFDRAEVLTLSRMRETKEKMAQISVEIRKLSEQLGSHSTPPKGAPGAEEPK